LSEICDAVAVIEKGKILATGTIDEIMTGLRQHRVLCVRLRSGKDDAMRFLLEQPGVARVLDANDRLQLEFTGDDAEQVALLGKLVGAGFPILEFNAEGAGLEDVFMRITAGKVQ
jgi:ABC-2 type transport system ATP-binding protein